METDFPLAGYLLARLAPGSLRPGALSNPSLDRLLRLALCSRAQSSLLLVVVARIAHRSHDPLDPQPKPMACSRFVHPGMATLCLVSFPCHGFPDDPQVRVFPPQYPWDPRPVGFRRRMPSPTQRPRTRYACHLAVDQHPAMGRSTLAIDRLVGRHAAGFGTPVLPCTSPFGMDLEHSCRRPTRGLSPDAPRGADGTRGRLGRRHRPVWFFARDGFNRHRETSRCV